MRWVAVVVVLLAVGCDDGPRRHPIDWDAIDATNAVEMEHIRWPARGDVPCQNCTGEHKARDGKCYIDCRCPPGCDECRCIYDTDNRWHWCERRPR